MTPWTTSGGSTFPVDLRKARELAAVAYRFRWPEGASTIRGLVAEVEAHRAAAETTRLVLGGQTVETLGGPR